MTIPNDYDSGRHVVRMDELQSLLRVRSDCLKADIRLRWRNTRQRGILQTWKTAVSTCMAAHEGSSTKLRLNRRGSHHSIVQVCPVLFKENLILCRHHRNGRTVYGEWMQKKADVPRRYKSKPTIDRIVIRAQAASTTSIVLL